MGPEPDALSQLHRPVLLTEVLSHLAPAGLSAPGALVVDGTVGLGGHAQALLEAYPTLTLLGLDRDPEALALAARRLAPFGARLRLAHASYAEVAETLAALGLAAPRAVLLDLGVSSLQLDREERGFSFRGGSAEADMRFDPTGPDPSAALYVNRVEERELARVLFEYGGEPRARAVARALVRARPLRTTGDVAAVARRFALRRGRLDPATRTFQGLRMAVNDEPGHLARGLTAALGVLAPGGRLAVIAFHSGEERLVKQAFREAQRAGRGRVQTKKPVRATPQECAQNPRARPARLRVFEVAAERVEGGAGDGDGQVGEATEGRVGP